MSCCLEYVHVQAGGRILLTSSKFNSNDIVIAQFLLTMPYLSDSVYRSMFNLSHPLSTSPIRDLGQMIILSLIIKRTRIKALVKDKRVAMEAFGTYVEVGGIFIRFLLSYTW